MVCGAGDGEGCSSTLRAGGAGCFPPLEPAAYWLVAPLAAYLERSVPVGRVLAMACLQL